MAPRATTGPYDDVTGVADETTLAPVAAQDRVPLFDVWRGFCLFGVLWSNLNDAYLVNAPATSYDRALLWTQDWLLEQRFYNMLGFLFGVGFAIQLTRAAQRGRDATALFRRRMAVLLGIGLVHATLVYRGDILTTYALVGLVLVVFRRLSPRGLLVAAAGVWLLLPTSINEAVAALGWHWPAFSTAQALSVYAHGSWGQAVIEGTKEFFWRHWRWAPFTMPAFLAVFLCGVYAVRVDLIARLQRRLMLMVWSLVGAVAVWFAAQFLELNIVHWPDPSATWIPLWPSVRAWKVNQITGLYFVRATEIANAAVYGLVVILLMSFPTIGRRAQPLAALGRMPLTTYLAQSLVCTTLFYHWGFGLMTTATHTSMLETTVLLFSVQLLFSVWWLQRYRFGPAEWLWRSLAYGRKLPLRVSEAEMSGPTIAAAGT